jgi:hypothetical protein
MAEAESPSRLPPYAPFKSFMKFMDGLKDGFVPPRLDSSYMRARKFSGSMASQVLTALRFLGLVSGAEPTETLRAWAKQSGDDWKKTFEKILRTSYAPMFEIDLETATDQMFRERFRRVYGVEGEIASKVITFFTKACNEAGIQLSPLIAKRSPAGTVRKPRSRRPEAAVAEARVVESEPAEPPPTAPPSSPAELEWAKFKLLVEKFPRFDPTWPDDLKARWFAAYEKFMATNIGSPE